MGGQTEKLGLISGIIASALCLVAGLWIVTIPDAWNRDDPIYLAIGLYFIGKAFFVGPMLIITSRAAANRDG